MKFWVTNLVEQESATIISHRVDMDATRDYLVRLHKDVTNWIWMDEKAIKLSWQIFLTQTKKGTSFVDCSNLAAIKIYHLDNILSFDSFYPIHFRV
ncbi:MAG: hypothetical protein AAB874_05360 [Patescibacteria group bacterium]